MKKRGNAVASIVVVITLIAGTSFILFNPYRQSDELIDYTTNLFFLQSHWDREYYEILNDFFHSRDDTYWYYNFSSYPPVNTTLDKIIERFNINGSIEAGFINITYNGTNLTYPDLSNPPNMSSFWIEQKEINVTFESLNEKRIMNTSHIYRAGDLFLLYKELYRWLENDAGGLSNELNLVLRDSGNEGCRFGICSCEDLDVNKDRDNRDDITTNYGITQNDIEIAIQNSINKLNNNLSLDGKFNCSIGNEKNISFENRIVLTHDNNASCTPDGNIEKLGNSGNLRRGVLDENLNKDIPPAPFNFDIPISERGYSEGSTNFFNEKIAPIDRGEDETNIFAYYYDLHKNAMGEIPIICEHLNEDLELIVWIHFNVQRKCTDTTKLPTNNTAICPEEDDDDNNNNGGGGDDCDCECGCCDECGCCCCDEECECDCCDDCECDCDGNGDGDGDGDGDGTGPKEGDECEEDGDCEGLECKICEVPYCHEEHGCMCIPAPEGTPCGQDACKELGCDENGACTIPLNIFNPNAPCNPNNINQTGGNLNQYCSLCGDQGLCDKPAFNTTKCGDGEECHVLNCNGTHSGTLACNLIVPQDPGTECGTCTVCSDDGHCNVPALNTTQCADGDECHILNCNGVAFGEAACNLIEPKNVNQECDTCTLCNEHGECNKPAGNTTICESGYCGNYYCNETGTGEAACNDYRAILSRKDDPCTSWKLGENNPTHRATCTLCGEQGLCNKPAFETQICGTHDYCSQMYCSGDAYGTSECKVRSAKPNRIGEYCKPGDTVSSGSQIDCAKCNSDGNCVATIGATCRTTTCGVYICVGAGSSNCNLDVSESQDKNGIDCGQYNNCGEKQCMNGICSFQGKLVDSRCNWNLECGPYCNTDGKCRWDPTLTCEVSHNDCGSLSGMCNANTGVCETELKCCPVIPGENPWSCHKTRVCCLEPPSSGEPCPTTISGCPGFG